MDRIVKLPTVEGLLFTFKDVVYSPEAPRMNETVTVKGKIDLFRLRFFGPIWVIATVTAPETLWEHYTPFWGAPEIRADATAIGGDFEVTFPKLFDREGEYSLAVRAYAGPTMPLDSLTLPPFPPVASFETTFTVSGEAPPEEELFQDFKIKAYGKGSAEPVTPPEILELEQGDTCRIHLEMSHKGPAVSGEFYASIGDVKPLIGFDEVLVGRGDFTTPPSDDWELYEAHVDIPITAAISPGSYDLYAKIREITGADVISPILDDVITIKGVPEEGEITNLRIESYDSPVAIGDACKVKVSFDYLGPEVSRRLYSAIGNYGWAGFDEIVYGSETISIPESEVPTSYEADVSIPITTAIDPAGSPYSLYAKIDGVISPVLEGVITIAGAVAEGSITSKYINKAPEGSRIPLPTTVTADRNTFEVGVTARNTGTAAYIGGIEVKVYDPDGTLRASPAIDWAGISPNEELGWEYNICPVDKPGTWTAEITFLTKDGVELDRFEGACLEAIEEKYEGSITGKWINKAPEGSRIPIPTEVKADSHTFEVGVKYKNYSGRTITGGCKVEVRDPDGILRASPAVDWTGMSDNEELSKEYNICRVDKPGDWTIHIDFLIDSTVVDDYDGLLFTAVEEAPPEAEFRNLKITSMTRKAKIGETCHMNISFEYRGPIITKELYGAIGNVHHIPTTWFDEIIYSSEYIEIPAAASWGTCTASVDIPITSAISPGTYDAYVKIDGITPEAISPYYGDALIVEEEEVVEHRLTLHASPSAGGTVSGGGTYPHMERVTITAHPNPGYYFDHWGGDFVSSDNPAQVYMSSDRDVTAYFYEEAVEEFTVTVRADPSHGGTVSKDPDKPKYEYGELIRLSCTPASGYYLNYWTRDGEWIESRTSFTTGVIRNHIFIAHFRER